MSRQRLRYLVQKEFRQLRRDKRLLRMIVIVPILQLTLLGYAATTDVRHISLAVCDRDHSAESRQLITDLARVGYFDIKAMVDDPRQLVRLLDSGRAQLALDIPPDFSQRLAKRRTATVQVLADGSDSNTATIALQYLTGTVSAYNGRVLVERHKRSGGIQRDVTLRVPMVNPEPRVWYNPELASVNFTVPALVALILFTLNVSLTALSIVREREIGTLEQLIVTPLRPFELLLGKIIPFILLGYVDITLVLLVARLWFRVPLEGSLLLLYVSAGIFLLSTMGIGLLISTISRTQHQAQLVTFFITMPSILLSGFMFPISNMPTVVQWVTYAIPVRYFLVIVRGIFLKGSGLHMLWGQVLALLIFGIIFFGAGVMRFQKKVS